MWRKRQFFRKRLGILCGVILAVSASAQTEQWLEYHTTRNGRGYRVLEFTTNAPSGVALPALNGTAYFANWPTPLDQAGGRWLCLDGKRKNGPRNRLYIDRNGNGRLDDESPVEASERDEYATIFEPVKMVFKGEDGPISYHVAFQFSQYDNQKGYLYAASAGFYEGKVNLGGQKRRVQLIDGNANGAFNDWSVNPSQTDRIVIDDNETDARFLGRFVEIAGQLFQIEVARDGAFLKVQKAENVPMGRVQVPDSVTEFTAMGENGHFVRKPASGASLPQGKYRLLDWKSERRDDKGVAWQLLARSYGDSEAFEVGNAPTVLDLGGSVRASLQASETTTQTSFRLQLQGSKGESVEITRAGARPRGPQLILASRDGTYRRTNTFEYG
jgi:hypothetical protein